ncbi:MAG: alpha/beta hydrolase [Patescibacteria group bacterium]|nr:alpha/beta hydrolase [Patescibacteria group bacterium]
MNVVVNDLLVHYELQGQGKPVLLLHGWGDSLTGLTGLRKSLATSFQVVSLDLPGFGTTQTPKTVWNLDNYAQFLQAFLAKVDCTPYAVIGHSNGGALAIRAISLQQLQPEKLVLLAASGIRAGNSGRRLALKVIAKAGNATTIWLPKPTRQRLRKQLYGAAGSDLLVVEHLQETFKETVRQDVQADAARLTLPTLLIYADQDQAVPLQDGRTYQSLIKNSKLEVITGAGHFVHLDKSDQVNRLIEEFLA